MRRRVWLLAVIVFSCLSMCGCLLNPPSSVVYTIENVGLEINTPATWRAEALGSLLVGIEFTDGELKSAMTSWILYGDATGRSLDDQLADLQAVMAFILDPGLIVTGWDQEVSTAFSVGGESGRRAEVHFYLSGQEMMCVAVAVTHQDLDILMIGQCTQALWESMERVFDDTFRSLVFL